MSLLRGAASSKNIQSVILLWELKDRAVGMHILIVDAHWLKSELAAGRSKLKKHTVCNFALGVKRQGSRYAYFDSGRALVKK